MSDHWSNTVAWIVICVSLAWPILFVCGRIVGGIRRLFRGKLETE